MRSELLKAYCYGGALVLVIMVVLGACLAGRCCGQGMVALGIGVLIITMLLAGAAIWLFWEADYRTPVRDGTDKDSVSWTPTPPWHDDYAPPSEYDDRPPSPPGRPQVSRIRKQR